jgi:hypothetical protein
MMPLKNSTIRATVRGALAIAALTMGLLFTSDGLTGQQQNPSAPPQGRRPGGGMGFSQPDPINFDDHTGWTQIFDGKTLNGWDGPTDIWHVEDGAIVGVSTPEHPAGSTNIIWRGGEPANFELKLEIKLEGTGANGGIQYRSSNIDGQRQPVPADRLAQMTDAQKQQMQRMVELSKKYAKWGMRGYQADADYNNRFTGQLYEQATGRGIIAWPGQVVEADANVKPRLLGTLESADTLKSYIKQGDWNQYEIIADGNTMIHILNGHIFSIFVDQDPKFMAKSGLIGLEIEGGGDVKISHRNIWLKELP